MKQLEMYLEKIATALGLNVSVFLDFNIETVGDVLSILFAIDDSVNLSLSETSDQKITMTFDNPTMQDFFKKWCQFKNVYEKEKAEILAIEDEDKRQEELDKLNATQEEWLSLSEASDQKITMTFDNSTMQDFFKKWCQFKNVYEKEKAEILAIEDEDKRQEELDKLNATQEEWKLRAMGTTIGCHTVIKKGTEGNEIKTYNLT